LQQSLPDSCSDDSANQSINNKILSHLNFYRLYQYIQYISLLLIFSGALFVLQSCREYVQQNIKTIELRDNWRISPSFGLTAAGAEISKMHFNNDEWINTTVPSTVLGALVNAGKIKDPFMGKNLSQIPIEQFSGSWWYRTEFDISENTAGTYYQLEFDGINYKANIWLNGKQIAAADSALGAFRTFSFDVTNHIKSGSNVLAVEVFPPQSGDFTIGFVDWNPQPPDKNMGIWRTVRLKSTGKVEIVHPFIQSRFTKNDLSEAGLTISVNIQNLSADEINGVLEGDIEGRAFKNDVKLQKRENRTIQISFENEPALKIENPRVWWPNNLGEPNLYSAQIAFRINGKISDQLQQPFGIREIKDYFNEEGHRGYMVNGRKLLIRGGGWVDDLFLNDTPEKLEAQIQYVKHMNLNTIRLEGFWGKDHTLYDLCDRYGILIMAGWSCQWEWDGYLGKACDRFGGVKSADDIDLVSDYWRDQITMFRNHPGIFVWLGGSDKLPRPEFEKKLLQILKDVDPSRPYLGSAASKSSAISGPTGVKMNGPYDYVPPIYWYVDTKNGGAFGFNTETGPGPQPPPLSSLKEMIPLDKLWPENDVWNYHCGRNEFNTLNRYNAALDVRYGKAENLDDYLKKAQVMNYEAMRAMFESFAAHKYNSTGIIQWMLNSAWPELYWQLYDYFLMPNGAFYGARKASKPLHVIYDYGKNCIVVNNDYSKPINGLKLAGEIFDKNSKNVFRCNTQVAIEANSVKVVEELPKFLPADDMFFLSLQLKDSSSQTVDDNFYWISAKKEIMNFAKTEWFVTPIKQYADFSALAKLKTVTLESSFEIQPSGEKQKITVNLKNPSETIAFFIELQVVDKESGEPLLPVFWDDNYISLLPGEERTITAEYTGISADVQIAGWNIVNK
jgi:exo-1,4-beta-D-glucosaminidase